MRKHVLVMHKSDRTVVATSTFLDYYVLLLIIRFAIRQCSVWASTLTTHKHPRKKKITEHLRGRTGHIILPWYFFFTFILKNCRFRISYSISSIIVACEQALRKTGHLRTKPVTSLQSYLEEECLHPPQSFLYYQHIITKKYALLCVQTRKAIPPVFWAFCRTYPM